MCVYCQWITDVAHRIDYKDARGKQRTWETAERRTRPKGGDIDGVGIVAILEKSTGQEKLSPPWRHLLAD